MAASSAVTAPTGTRRRTSAMSTGGFSKARLERLHDTMAGDVDRGAVPAIRPLGSRPGGMPVGRPRGGRPPSPAGPPEPDEWLRRFGTLPLIHQPGEQWMYNTGSDVLGVLLARASGRPLPQFLAERLFEPLGMVDTGFHVPPEKIDRLVTG